MLTPMDTRYSAVCRISSQSILTMSRQCDIIRKEEGAYAPSGFNLKAI